jgi:hypothetical protein
MLTFLAGKYEEKKTLEMYKICVDREDNIKIDLEGGV